MKKIEWIKQLPFVQFYNSISRKMERFEPRDPLQVLIYSCGPTVYDYTHIGNLRTFIFEDLLRRTLLLFGYGIKQVMNLTDVDDKTIKKAIENRVDLASYTEQFAQAFFNDIDALNIQRVEHYPRATEYIPAMIAMILQLIEKGHAYQGADKSVYFSIASFAHYGRLARLDNRVHDTLENRASAEFSRLSSDEYEKDDIGDFVLWKAFDKARDGAIFWPSPFGPGRPGWHIECSAMVKALLGEQIDIHTGGIDNLFPHHENEIAQSECCHHAPLARYWLHSQHLLINAKKMSKSSGNFYTLRDLLAQSFEPTAIRYLLLQTHYRHSLNFTIEGLHAAQRSLDRLRNFWARLKSVQPTDEINQELQQISLAAGQAFLVALADDLNISAALAAVFEWSTQFNRCLDSNKVGRENASLALQILASVDAALGILETRAPLAPIPEPITQWNRERLQARQEKNWSLADELRAKMFAAGFIVEDSALNSAIKRR